jgi:hypothetical protein
VSARHHALSHHRDQFLNMLDNRRSYHEKKKKARAEAKAGEKKKHTVPGRSRLVQQEATQTSQDLNNNNANKNNGDAADEDEEVLIDDEPTSEPIALPAKKRKLSYNTEQEEQEKR